MKEGDTIDVIMIIMKRKQVFIIKLEFEVASIINMEVATFEVIC